MRVIIDTNVLVSGIFWQGVPARILEAWVERRFRLVVSTSILEEYQAVIHQLEKKYPSVTVSRTILQAVGLYADIVEPVKLAEQVCTDPNDDKFLAAALSGNVDCIVTGDAALLKTDGYKGIRVAKPSSFLLALR